MYLKTVILIFLIQVDEAKKYGPVHSIDDLVHEVSKAVSESPIAMTIRIYLL